MPDRISAQSLQVEFISAEDIAFLFEVPIFPGNRKIHGFVEESGSNQGV